MSHLKRDHLDHAPHLTDEERDTLEGWLWWVRCAVISDTPEEITRIAGLSVRWAQAAYHEGLHESPAWLTLWIGLRSSVDPRDQARARRVSTLNPTLQSSINMSSAHVGYTASHQRRERALADARESLSALDEARHVAAVKMITQATALKRAALSSHHSSHQADVDDLKGHDADKRSSQGFNEGPDRRFDCSVGDQSQSELQSELQSEHLSNQLIGYTLQLLGQHITRHPKSPHLKSPQRANDITTLNILRRHPHLCATLTPRAPSHDELIQVSALSAHLITQWGETRRETNALSCVVIERFEFLSDRAQRILFRDLTDDVSAIGPPPRARLSVHDSMMRGRETRTARVSASGALIELGRRGSLERVSRGELVHLGHELAPGIDSFTLRWIERELLFHRRDQETRHVDTRSWRWCFHRSSRLTSGRSGRTPLALAHAVSLWTQRALTQAFERHTHDGSTQLITQWVWSERWIESRSTQNRSTQNRSTPSRSTQSRSLKKSRSATDSSNFGAGHDPRSAALERACRALALEARDELRAGRCHLSEPLSALNRSPESPARPELDVIWTTDTELRAPGALVIYLAPEHVQLQPPRVWRDVWSDRHQVNRLTLEGYIEGLSAPITDRTQADRERVELMTRLAHALFDTLSVIFSA